MERLALAVAVMRKQRTKRTCESGMPGKKLGETGSPKEGKGGGCKDNEKVYKLREGRYTLETIFYTRCSRPVSTSLYRTAAKRTPLETLVLRR